MSDNKKPGLGKGPLFAIPNEGGLLEKKPLQPITPREGIAVPAAEPAPSTEPAPPARPATGANGARNAAVASEADWGAAGDAIRFLQGFDVSGWHNMVAFDPASGRPSDGRSFYPGTWRKMAKWLNEQLARDFNVYFSVNEPRPNAPSGKLKKSDIARIRALFGDVDPQGGAEELAAEQVRIRDMMAELADGPNATQLRHRFRRRLPGVLEDRADRMQRRQPAACRGHRRQPVETAGRRRRAERRPDHAAAGHRQHSRREEDPQGPRPPPRNAAVRHPGGLHAGAARRGIPAAAGNGKRARASGGEAGEHARVDQIQRHDRHGRDPRRRPLRRARQ